MFLVAPQFVDRSGDWAADSKLVPVADWLTLIIGAHLSWIAYLM